VVTDTIDIPEEKRFSLLKVLTVAPLLAAAILRIHKVKSVSVLYDNFMGL